MSERPSSPNEALRQAAAARQRGDQPAAEQIYRDLTRTDPQNGQAWLLLGASLAAQQKFSQAAAALQEAVALQPQLAAGRIALAYALSRSERPVDAECEAREAIRLQRSPDALLILAQAQLIQRKFADAETTARDALTMNASHAAVHNVLGMSLHGRHAFSDAERALRRSLELNPNNAEVWTNLGRVLSALERFDEAIVALERAIQLSPNDREAHLSLAGTLLLTGDFARGFREFEHRWFTQPGKEDKRTFAQPEWDGSPMEERRIFVHVEQGFGDTIQCARFLPMLFDRGASQVIVEVQPPLVSVIKSVSPRVQVVTSTAAFDGEFDVYVALMSLPYRMGITLQTLPASVPYLHADAARVQHWGEMLLRQPGKRVGIAWAGNRAHGRDHLRSISPSLLSPLSSVPNVSFVALQFPREDPRGGTQAVPLFDPSGQIRDFADTAALVENLDLVIGVDTAIVHLAGALSRPVWTMIDTENDWRWMRARDDSPWYPTMRLFRQSRHGDWMEVIARVADELAKFAK